MSSRTATASPSGHTLWELLVVLALLAGIAALVAPDIATFHAIAADNELTRSTRNVLDVLAQARKTALERGNRVTSVIDPKAARVWVYESDGDEWRVLGTCTLAITPSVVLFAAGPRVRYTFDPSGTASGDSLIVRGQNGTRVVSVDPWSGVANAQSR